MVLGVPLPSAVFVVDFDRWPIGRPAGAVYELAILVQRGCADGVRQLVQVQRSRCRGLRDKPNFASLPSDALQERGRSTLARARSGVGFETQRLQQGDTSALVGKTIDEFV